MHFSDKVFHFPGKFHFLVKTITDSDRFRLIYLYLLFSTANGVMFCEIFLQSEAHITTGPRFIYSFYFQVLFNRSSIPDSSILDPDFPVSLEVLHIKIVLFFLDHWSDRLFQNNQHFQAIEFLDPTVPEKLDMGFLFYGHEVLQVECADSQVQSYPYKHIRDTHVTLVWISNDAFLAPHL